MRLREATEADAALLFEWRNDSGSRAASRDTEVVGANDHLDWFDNVLANPARHLLIAEHEGTPVGEVRFDHVTANAYEISVIVDPVYRRKGLGKRLISEAVEWLWANTAADEIKAVARKGNEASRRAFKAAGFVRVGTNDGFVRLSLRRNPWEGKFGDAYTERNLGIQGRGRFWNDLCDRHGIRSALEVGCNTGTNLVDLNLANLAGVDVNSMALELVPQHISTYQASATDLPFAANEIDLVFTFGVLIHIPPEDLELAMREIVRCSRRLVFAGEYLGDDEVPYRGGVLWRRDYGRLYEEIGLRRVERGILQGQPWDRGRVDWWLLTQER